LAEAYIRELHRVICQGQPTYKVYTSNGIQEHELPLGEYKQYPNHVLQRNGKIHSYSPVDMTGSEMHRLCQELNKTAFIETHPILQASYIHYCVTVIHPFADGNVRVARALASIYTYRANSIPLLITDETKQLYFDSREAADNGDYQKFINFIFERGLDSMRLLEESLGAAIQPALEESTKPIEQLFISKGGYKQSEVDQAAYTFFSLFIKEISQQIADLTKTNGISIRSQPIIGAYLNPPSRSTNRFPIEDGQQTARIFLDTKKPAEAHVVRTFVIEVPKDSGYEDDLFITSAESPEDAIEARISEVIPSVSISFEVRLKIAMRRILAHMVDELSKGAGSALEA